MKRTTKILTLIAALGMFAAPALAQAKECTEEFKTATYSKWYDNRKEHQDVAYQAAKEYLATCPADDSPYKTALKKFADAYDAMNVDVNNGKQFEAAVAAKNYTEQMRLGKLVLASSPDNTAVYILMGVAGLGDQAVLADSVQYAKKAIEMVEGAKPFAPLTSKDEALAFLNYDVAKSLLKNAPADAIPYLLKAARYESSLKKNAQLYAELAGAYGEGPVTKLSEEYKAKFTIESPESKLAMANINQLIDRQIDALARAAALSPDAANKKAVMDVLSGLYKDRMKTEAGLNELVAGILAKPLPDLPTPLTVLPATPATTPATSGSSSGANTAQPMNSNTGAKTAGTGTAPAGNKKPKRNHRAD